MSTIKKISCFLCFIFVASIVGICNVKAINITIEGADKVSLNKTIDIKFTVSDYNDVPGNIYIDYPSNILQCNSNCPKTQKITGNTTFTYQFRGISNGEALIKVTSSYNIPDASPKKIIVGTGTTSTTKPAPSAPTPSTTTQALKSNNANLKTLEITGSDDSEVVLSPSFSSNVYEYSATVAGEVKTITINATMEDSKANMVVSNNATEELVAGENNKIVITVTAEDGTKKAYTINIKREALTADATLKSLTIKECSDFELKENKFSYSVKIKDSVKKLTLDYVTSDENAEVSISGNENLKNGSKVKILVTAQDGTKKEYVLNIVKDTETTKKSSVDVEAEKNPLIIMALSMVAFGLIGGIIYVIKK